MANTSGYQYPVGVRRIQIYELNANGTPLGTIPGSPYVGYQLKGAKTYGFNSQEPRKFTHVGDDQALQIDFLPALQAGDAEIAVSAMDYTAIAKLSGVKVFTVGEASAIPLATDRQGFEPLVGMMIYQQSKDRDTGLRRWRVALLPSVQCVFLQPGMGADLIDARYKISPTISNKHIWGTALLTATEGALTSQGIELMTEGLPQLGAFVGDGVVVLFNFPTGIVAVSTAKITVWKNDVLVVAGLTKTINGFTFAVAPLVGDRIVYFVEYV